VNVKTERLSSNKVKLEITVAEVTFEKSIDVAYKKMKNKINVPNFRPGKAPKSFIEKLYGKEVFYEEAFNDAIPKAYYEAIQQENVEVVSDPEYDIVSVGEGDLVFTAEVYVRPEFTLGQYKGVEVTKKEYPVKEEEIEAKIKADLDKNTRWIDAEDDYAAKSGDRLNINYKGLKDGVAFDGGTAEGHTIDIGSNTFIPGFEDNLIGMKKGEEKAFDITFPEDYFSEELKGQAVVFEVKVNDIKIKDAPALDDEFAKDVSEFETFEEYKNDIKAKLEENANKMADADMENELIEKICDATEIDIPQSMIDTRIDAMIEDMSYRIRGMGINFEQYLQYTGMTMEQVREENKETAAKQVKGMLVLEEVGKVENIEATDEDIENQYAAMAKEARMDVEKVKEMFANNDAFVRNRAVTEKTLKLLKDAAVYTDAPAEPKKAAKKPAAKKKAAPKAEAAADAPVAQEAEAPAPVKKPRAKKTVEKPAEEEKAE